MRPTKALPQLGVDLVGDPVELGAEHAQLKRRQPQLNVMGGCCGTDHRHIQQIAAACSPLFRKTR